MKRITAAIAFASMTFAVRAEMAVDCDFPGGNIRTLGIDEAKNEIRIAPDMGDSKGWFWFYFRVTGAEGRTVRFSFPKSGTFLGPLGPCVSDDDGKTWKFLDESGFPNTNEFTYTFAKDAKAVRFAHGEPYTEMHWREFTARFRDDPRVKFGTLCKSRRDGRDVELVVVEPASGVKPKISFFFTCRHHCAEASASPVLEGLLEAALANDDTGRWIRENSTVYFVPFMDKDGVERGEQGKNRNPWDYNRDYLKERYPEVRAFKKLMVEKSAGTQIYYIDCHSPWIRGNEHEWYYSLGPLNPERPELDRRWRDYRRALAEATKNGPLAYEPKWDIPGEVGYNVPENLGGTDYPSSTRWCVTLPNLYCGFCMEYGYGLCGGVFSREKARTLGRQTFQAIMESMRLEMRTDFITVPSDRAPVVEAEVETVAGKHASLLPKGVDWKLVWNDEFDQKEIDRSKWLCRESFWGYDFPAFAHDYEGVEMTGETVKLNLLRKGDDYASPHLQTGSLTYDIPKEGKNGFWPFGRRVKPTFMHRYGYWEIRCRLNRFNGWHSAFWLQAPGVGSHPDAAVAGTEVDIMESWMLRPAAEAERFGNTRGFIVGGIISGGYGADGGGFGHFRWPHNETADGWHNYGCNWTPYGYEFYCDGVKICEQNWPVSQVEEFVLVSTEPGGYRRVGNDGGLSASRKTREWGRPFPCLAEAAADKDCFEVDYVRVYDNAAGYGDRPEALPVVDVPQPDPATAVDRAQELFLKVNRLTVLPPEDVVKEVSEADLLRMNSEALALDRCEFPHWRYHHWMKSITVSCAKLMRARREARGGKSDERGEKNDGGVVKDAVQPFVDSGECPGMISVLCRGDRTETACIGWADVEKRRSIGLDQPYMACSQTKGVCGVAAAILIDDGKLDLDDPVSKYIPQYKSLMLDLGWSNGCQRLRRAKNVMTVRHLLTHTSGLDFESPVFGKDKLGWTAAPLKVTAYMGAAYPLRHEPGTHFGYSNFGMNVAAAVIEVASGMPFEKFLAERLFRPLGMTDTTFEPTDEQLSRAIQLYEVEPGKPATKRKDIYTMPLPHNGKYVFPSAGAGLWTTARDFVKFYRMLMNRGVGDNGVRILKEGTVRDILERKQTPDGVTANYSLGFFVDKGGWWGHGGAWGTDALIEPNTKSLKFLVQQMHSVGNGKDRPWPWEKAFYGAADAFMKEKSTQSGYMENVVREKARR